MAVKYSITLYDLVALLHSTEGTKFCDFLDAVRWKWGRIPLWLGLFVEVYVCCLRFLFWSTLVISHARKLKSIHTTTVLWPFFRDHPGEPVPEENFWTLWWKGRLTEADTPTIWHATPSGLSSAHVHRPPFFTGRMPFLPPNQQCQSTEGN